MRTAICMNVRAMKQKASERTKRRGKRIRQSGRARAARMGDHTKTRAGGADTPPPPLKQLEVRQASAASERSHPILCALA